MGTTTTIGSRWIVSVRLLPLLVSLLALVLPSSYNPIAGTAADTGVHRLDLSYLHRCEAGDLAKAIRGTLEHEEVKSTAEEEETVVDIDLTASLIGKNLSEILGSLKREDEEEESAGGPTYVRLTARRNQWSPREATTILEFVCSNGPTNVTIAVVDDTNTNATTNDSSVASSIEDTSSSKDDGPSVETTNDPNTNDNVDEKGKEETSTTEGVKIETSTTGQTTTFFSRPAFVSIQSLDLGWNNLGSDPSDRRAARLVNKALRKLLADSKQCPPTIRLDVCGLGPPACRDMAKGIVERYENSADIPPSLSVNLARNEGIGDVGVAALAAGIRTVVSRRHPQSFSSNNSDGKKKRRRRKKKRRSKQTQEDNEEEDERETNDEDGAESEIEQAEEETIEQYREILPTKEKVDGSSAGAPMTTIFECLDLSGCGIGDVGAEALAIALRNNPLCIKYLDLTNNNISDEGAAALARALGMAETPEGTGVSSNTFGRVETLDLSHNKDLGDRGAKALANSFRGNGMTNLILRSCNIRADGAACFGTALRAVGSRTTAEAGKRLIDLSGNPLGVLVKKKKSGKLSAMALRSKATDTTKAYMNMIGKSFQKGLNSINSLANADGLDTLESDDEEEERIGGNDEDEDESQKKCGAISLAEAFISEEDQKDQNDLDEGEIPVNIELGLRHCSFDTKAAEALAAILQESRQKYPRIKLTMDMTMNHVLEDDIIAALHGEEGYNDQLADMAEVYLDALEVMREARERALKAARMAAARARAQAERDASWGAPLSGPRYSNHDEGAWSDDRTEDDQWEHPNAEEENYSDEEW